MNSLVSSGVRRFVAAGLLVWLGTALSSVGQVVHTVTAPANVSYCDSIVVTTRLQNTGLMLDGLQLHQVLPHNGFRLIPGSTVLQLPGGVVSGPSAEPVITGQTNLLWDFSSVSSGGGATHVVISEVNHRATPNSSQWIELFNPTPAAVDMTGWSIKDTVPGQSDALPPIIIQPGEFVIIAASTNSFATDYPGYTGRVFQVSDGAIGNGLNNFGDGVLLVNAASVTVDAMSYGASVVGFNPSAPLASPGQTLQRSPSNKDTNTRGDWVSASETPGTGIAGSAGIDTGDGIIIEYGLEIVCGSVAGQIRSFADYYQPAGGTFRTNFAAAFVTVNPGDLVVLKTPVVQSGGVGDEVVWQVTVRNEGFGDAKNVEITDRLGAGLAFEGFSVNPLQAAPYPNTVTWDSTVISALTNLAPQQEVTITVTGKVVGCSDLLNRADAKWGCFGMQTVTNSYCEDTSLLNETAGASIQFIDRYPQLKATLAPAAVIGLDYCEGTELTLYVTNTATGPKAGTGYDIRYLGFIPDGYTVQGASVTGASVSVGTLAPGQSTSVTFRLIPGSLECPVILDQQDIYFYGTFRDACSNTYAAAPQYTEVRVVQEPRASVTKIMPESVNPSGSGFNVTVLYTYSNLVNSTVNILDTYRTDSNLVISGITPSGTHNPAAGTIEWTTVLNGSGVYTASYHVAFVNPCSGPYGAWPNRINAQNSADCQGCTIQVVGDNATYYTDIARFYCGTEGTDTCSFTSAKWATPELAEVCEPVQLTHTFTNFSGGALPGSWNGVVFTSSLANGRGYLASTSSVQVTVNGSNVTPFVNITATSPNLVINLAGLNASPFSSPGAVTNALTIMWEVASTNIGILEDRSTLPLGACGIEERFVSWEVGESHLRISLENPPFFESCGFIPGRIELTQLSDPPGFLAGNRLFPSYDVQVVLNLDEDGSGTNSFSYVPNSTIFADFYDLLGNPIPAVEPTVVGNTLVWNIGDVRSNGVGTITYRLRAGCDVEPGEQVSAKVLYNNRCQDGTVPPVQSASSKTNTFSAMFKADLDYEIKPEILFLTTTQVVYTLEFVNRGAATAYDVRPEYVFPVGVGFNGASIAPSILSATNAIWNLALGAPLDSLMDMDGDGFYDDLPPGGTFSITVTGTVDSCDNDTVFLRATHGCGGESCQVPVDKSSTFVPLAGSIVTRTVFPADAELCTTNTVLYEVRNSGLILDRIVTVWQEIPNGMTYVPGSARYQYNGGPETAALTDPSGSNVLTFTEASIPEFHVLQPGDVLSLKYDVVVGCDAVFDDAMFRAQGSFLDLCGNTMSNEVTQSVMPVNQPTLTVKKEARNPGGLQSTFTTDRVYADQGDTVVFRVTIEHDPSSEASAYAVQLTDMWPTGITFTGASVAPNNITTSGPSVAMTWNSSTLLAQVGGAPWSEASGTQITILLTGVVQNCSAGITNYAEIAYGCSDSCLTLEESTSQAIGSNPNVASDSRGVLDLTTCGGTYTLTITNRGSTLAGMVITNTAPAGYIFTGASATGEFNSANLTLNLSGSPTGSIAVLDLRTAAASGATDVDDDMGDGLGNLDLAQGDTVTITFHLISDGSGLDCLANPTDLDYEDPDPATVLNVTARSDFGFGNVCSDPLQASISTSVMPNQPDPDIDLQPNSLLVTNGQEVIFTAKIRNNADKGNADNLHARLQFGTGWTNLTYVTNTIVSSSVTSFVYEIQGSTNVLISLPGVVLDPIDDYVEVKFKATAQANGNPLTARAEVVGECLAAGIVAQCTFLNTLGEPPMADTMDGTTIHPANGVYYGFDQDQSLGLGFNLTKTVRLAGEAAPGGTNRPARVGEDLIYRIHATYFGQVFSNVVVKDSLPTNLVFGVPVDAGSSAEVTNWTWNATTGEFTLPSPITNSVDFIVDIPVIVRNSLANQGELNNQTTVTNIASTTFHVTGATNVPPDSSTTIKVVEPVLEVIKTSNVGTNRLQAGDTVIFSNVIRHTSQSMTTAYDVVFSDTLPPGLTFTGISLLPDGVDNDGDGTIDEADEGTLISTNTITVTTNNNIRFLALATNESVTIVFAAIVDDQFVSTVITNRSKIEWTSLPGVGTNGHERTGDEDENPANKYSDDDPEPVPLQAIGAVTKSLIWTSQTNTVDPHVTIGERMVYRLRVDVPQGVISNLVVTDVVPPGLDFVGVNTNVGLNFPGYGYSVSFPAGNAFFDTNSIVVTDPDPTPADSLTNDGSGTNVVFRFGTFTNAPDNNLTNDYFFLDMEFVVLNMPINTGLSGNSYSNVNRAIVADAFSSTTVTSPVYNIAEHLTSVRKTRTPAGQVDAGDLITFSIIVSNSASALANAYDLVVSDVLSNSLFDTSTIVNTALPTGWAMATNTLGFGAELVFSSEPGVALAPGQTVTGSFTVVASQSLRPNQRFNNVVTLPESDTIDGTQPGGIPDRDRGSTNTTGLSVANLRFAKSLFSTSETNLVDSTSTNVQVGEIVTYRLDVTMPETTITNLLVTDDLPLGMGYIIGSARVDTNGFGGTLGTFNVLGPVGVNGTPAPSGSNVVIRFDGLSVVTGDNNTNNNSFAIYLDAVVLNTNTVVGLPGNQTLLTNTASVTFSGNPSNAIPAGPVVTPVIEPRLDILKDIDIDTGDAGDIATITLTVTNNGLATAYNVVVTDYIAQAFFDIGSLTPVTIPAGFVYTVTTNLPDATVFISSDPASGQPTNTIEVGETVTFVFTAALSQSVKPQSSYENVAGIESYDSIYNTPTSGVERTYEGPESSDSVDTPSLALAKALVRTSETGPVDTTGSDVTIGEVVTYRLTVTLPESTITNLIVTDFLPVGMQYWSNVVVDTSGFGGTLPGTPTVSGGGGNGALVSFQFVGATVVTGDNNTNNNSFSIEFDALVLDVATNDGLPPSVDGDGTTILTNRAQVTFPGNMNDPTPSDPVVVQVVEPSLLIQKTMSGPSNGVVIIDLVVTNRGLATAFDVAVTDLISTAWFDTTTIAPVSIPVGFTFNSAGAPGNATITIASDPASGQPTNSIEVGETVAFRFRATLIPGATGVISNTAVVSEYSTIDGDDPNERDEPPADDDDELPLPSFSIAKTLTSPTGRPAEVGEDVRFTITVQNTGPIGLGVVPLQDIYDVAYLAFSNATPTETSASPGAINWADVGPLPVGASTNIIVDFIALQTTPPGGTTNRAIASATTTNGLPLPPQTSSVPVEVLTPGFTLVKQLITPTGVATVGQDVVFTITLSNSGEIGLDPVPVVDTYDTARLTFVSAAPVQDSALPGTITWTNVGPLGVGDSIVLTTRFTMASSTWPNDTTNIVVASPSTTNGVPLDPQTSSVPVQSAAPAIGLIKLAGSAPDGGVHYTNAGADVVYTYMVTNSGDTHLSSVTVTDDVLGVIGTVTNVMAPGDIAFLYWTSSIPSAVTNWGTVIGTPSYTNGTPIPGLTNVVATNDAIVEIFAAIGDYVWLDVNGDGIQSGGSETGIPGVVVTLYDAATNVLSTTTTDSTGYYSFTNLVPGAYFVGFTPPSGYMLTQQDQGGDDTVDSDADPVTGFTALTVLESGEYDPTWDAGLLRLASLGDFVWNDLNGDGIQDAGEPGVSNVTVTLYDASSNVVGTTTTDSNGLYLFTNLVPGTYFVGFTPPAGFVFTQQDQGGDDTLDSDVNPSTGFTIPTTLVSGENDLTWDAGLVKPAALGDFVWNDLNADGIQDSGEPGYPGVVVNLLSNGVVTATTTTDVNGAYAFTNLWPGTYAVEFIAPTGTVISPLDQGGDDTVDSDADPNQNGRTADVVLQSGDNNPTLDAGLYLPARLGDFVWLDRNGDGIQDPGEPGVSNVTVTLYDANSNALATTTTDGAGAYGFTNLVPGTYFVGFTLPAGFEFTRQDQGTDDRWDSDADPITGFTAPTTLISGENDPTWDAGLIQRASLGDYVWEDTNADGIQDVGEPAFSNVVVNLLSNGVVIATTTTDVNGAYAFTNLWPGEYEVEFVPPPGTHFSPPNQGGDDTVDSDADTGTGRTGTVTLESGENNTTLDSGLYYPASLGDFVWLDRNGDGIQSGGSETGIPGVVVTLYDASSNVLGTATTDATGFYSFTNLVPGTYFVGFTPPAGYELTVQDRGGDDTLDSDADPITGFTIPTTLVSGENDPTWDAGLIQRAALGDFVWEDKDADGIQDAGEPGFSNVVVNLLSNGVVIATTTTDVNGAYAFTNLWPGEYQVEFVPPAGSVFTGQDQGGDDTVDSDPDRFTGLTGTITLESGDNDTTIDAGLFIPARLGDFVWLDVNGNGIQDAGEPGVSNVVVHLYDDTLAMVDTTTTDGTGYYSFTNLLPGTYTVGFELPAGYQFTLQNQGGDDTVDSDADRVTGMATATTLESGDNDTTWDAGLYIPASLGDFVWLDRNGDGIQDSGEPGVSNVLVTLYDANSNALATTTTDGSGAYGFTNLIPGTYFVGFTLPAGFEFTRQDQGGDDTLDSDADPVTGFTIPTTLISGQNDPTWDAGLIQRASLGDYVWEDTNADGIQDVGEPAFSNVVVNLLSNGVVIATTTTDVNGAYAFTNLWPGEYEVEFVPPPGTHFSPPNQGGDDTVDSDADTGTGRTGTVTLESGENNTTLDSGLYYPASLGDFVWLDIDGNGVQDGGPEAGIANVLVTLYDAQSNALATTTTDGTGFYSFTNLVPGTYFVGFTPPAGYAITLRDQGGDDTLDSDADPITGFTIPTTLVSGENDPTWDAGLYIPASLGNFVWDDLNRDGIQGLTEPGVSNVTVQLYDAANVLIATTNTDASGFYSFTNLIPGTYSVTFVLPSQYEFTLQDQGGDDDLDSDADPITGAAIQTVLVSGENDLSWDAGIFRRASLGDFVWLDTDGDGVQDPGESGMTNVVVNLLDTNGVVIATTVTDSTGYYSFTNLLPGTYAVEVIPPAGFAFSLPGQGGDGSLDSDVDVNTGRTPYVTLISGEHNPTLDAGLHIPASLGDFVWHDYDGDGLQGASETGMPGVVVHLYNTNGVIVSTTTTDVNGAYLFTNLMPAFYYVEFVPPTGYQFTKPDIGIDDELDSDVDPLSGLTVVTQLLSGENDLSWDAGVYLPATLGDQVFEDLDYNSVFDGPGEITPSVTGLTVNLYLDNGTFVTSTVTDATGAYLFTNLPPATYVVEFVKPTNFVFVTPLQGGDTNLDSNADQVTGRTDPITLYSGDDDRTWDAGLARYGALGDFVWWDINNDGIHAEDLTFYGINDVTVRLYRVQGGVTSFLAQAVTATDTNGNKGHYFFPALEFGDYYVEVDTHGIPNWLPRHTTVLSYNVTISPQYVFYDADFGFNLDPTAITLRYLRAVRTDDGVRVEWATASEFENLGYHIYRAASPDGERVRLTGEMIMGQGTGNGSTYAFDDVGADADAAWYWLEDISETFETTLHGPVSAGEAEEDEEETGTQLVGNFGIEAAGAGIYRLSYEELVRAGIAANSLRVADLKLILGGEEVALLPIAQGDTLASGDSVLFYVPAHDRALSVSIETGADALRMGWAYGEPAPEGTLWTGVVRSDGQLPFEVSPASQRYLLVGFEGDGAMVLDVTDAHRPLVLFDYAVLNIPGQSGILLSYEVEEAAQCLAVQLDAVRDVTGVTRAEP